MCVAITGSTPTASRSRTPCACRRRSHSSTSPFACVRASPTRIHSSSTAASPTPFPFTSSIAPTASPRWPTFYIGLSAEVPPDRRVTEPSGIGDFVRALVLTGMDGRDNVELEVPPAAQRAVHIDTSYVDPLDFGIDRATRQRLYDDGFAAVERFLRTFSFASYRQVWP